MDSVLKMQVEALLREGCAPEVIAGELGVSVAEVKLAGLEGVNSKGKALVEEGDITDAELAMLRGEAVAMARYAESETVRADMLQWLIERKRPTQKQGTGGGSVITQINMAINAGHEKFKKLQEEFGKQAVASNDSQEPDRSS